MSRGLGVVDPSTVLAEPEAEKYLGLPKGALAGLGGQAGGPQSYLHKVGGLRQYERAWLDAWQARQTGRSQPAPVAVASPSPPPVAPTVVANASPTIAPLAAPIVHDTPLAPPAKADPDDPAKPLEERIAACWQASADLRAEFGTFDVYSAYRVAAAAGRFTVNRGTVAAVPPVINPSAPAIEDRCAAAWRTDPDLRAEFGDNFESYLAFSRADAAGLVRIARTR